MNDDELRPLPFDESALQIQSMLDLADVQDTDSPWLFTAPGEYHCYALEAFKRDGSNRQTLIAVEWPARVRNTDEQRIVRLLIHPEDAIGLLDVMSNALLWLAQEGKGHT